MAICQIKRDNAGDIEKVLAVNGKESLAYKGLLDRVNKISNTSLLRERFRSWEGKHIMPITNKGELAIALYKQLYSPAFKSWMGDWSRLAKVKTEDPGNGYLIDQLGKTVRINLLDQNGEPKDEALDKVIEGPTNGAFRQVIGSTQPSKANPATIKKVQEFLSRIGVQVKEVEDIKVGGQRIGATGLADPINGLIQVSQGNMDVALTEEAMHIATEIIQQKDPKLFKQMMGQVGNYNLFTQVIRDYKDIKEYQTPDGKPDIIKLKKETIAKVLAQTIIDKNEGANENAAFLAQTKNWWDKILDFLKLLFNRAGFNPFETTAEKVLSGDIGTTEDIKQDSGTFLQVDKPLIQKLKENNQATAQKENGEFEVNGTKVRNTVMDKVAEYLKSRMRGREQRIQDEEFKKAQDEANDSMHTDLDDILNRYIDDNGRLRSEELPHVNPSALDPFDNTIYNTLEGNIKERLDSYPAGTSFMRSVNLYDGINTAGKADLIAILPDSKVDILQFKVPDIRFASTDIPLYKQESYNVEIEALRKILETGYGVRRADFRLTRAIPMKVRYAEWEPGMPEAGYKVIGLTVGNVDAKLIEDDTLLPIPSTSETTGNQKLDKFISRLRGLVQRLSNERVSPNKRKDKTNRITALLGSIRKLQVQQKADAVIRSGAVTVKSQQEKYTRLSKAIEETDPSMATLGELNKVASDILDDKDQVELYSDLYRVMKEILTDDSEESKEILRKAREISDDAQDSVDAYWNLSIKFRTKKLAAKFGIRDEFLPEKQLTWYRRMIRSLSQSSIKAGAILWHLVDKINSGSNLDFQERLTKLKKLEDSVTNWLKGRSTKELHSKILQLDKDGKWNGKFIQKFSRDFYKELRENQEKGGRQWVLNNIDVDAYREWYNGMHNQVVENSQNSRLHEDDVENDRRIKEEISNFESTFNIDEPGGTGTRNYKLRDFPLENKWESTEYNELRKPGNEPVLELYNYWREKLDESLDLGMIEEHNGWSWFPNVRKNRIEKLASGMATSGLLDGLKIEPEDLEFGKIDPLTGKPIDEIHANYVTDLKKVVQDTDGKYFDDYSEKSMDLFKVMGLWEREISRFKLKIESESLARMLAYTEQGQGRNLQKGALQTSQTGKLQKDEEGNPIIVDNDINARYVKDHIDAVYYGKGTSNESNIVIDIPVKAAAERINKFFGKEVITVPKQASISMSGVKALGALNRFFLTKTLGINVLTAASNLFGGTINTYINQGKFFTKKDVNESEVEMVSGRFWSSEENKKMAGLLSFFHPYLEDKSSEQIRKLSLNSAVRYFSSDHLFFMQRWSDEHVNQVIAMSYIKNSMVKDGKIVNIREQARKELGHEDKYNTEKFSKPDEFNDLLEKRVEEIKKSPEALLNYAKIVDDHIEIPGIERTGDASIQFRGKVIEFIKDALGNTSREDLSLYKRNVIMQSFFMFKNWIPRMVDVRGQSLKYNAGSQQYEWGRIRMLGTAVQYYLGGKVKGLKESLGGSGIVAVAKDMYKRKQQEFVEQGEDFDMNEAEFIDMYIKGVRSEIKEIALGLGLMGILFAARAAQPPKDDDPDSKGRYKWALRAIDKLQDEVNFFYNPTSFTDIVNGSAFPAISILVDIEKFLKGAAVKLFYELSGDDQKAENTKISKYVYKILPVTKELMNYAAIFDADFAKEYGVRVSSQNGSSR